MFGTAMRRKWTTKEKKSGSDNNTGAIVSVYQIQSDQPGLVPQFLRKLANAHIWAAQVMVDHFSDLP